MMKLNKKYLFLLIVAVLCLALVVSVIAIAPKKESVIVVDAVDTASVKLPSDEEYEEQQGEISLENDNSLFVLQTETGSFTVKDKNSGKIWHSNPVDAADDLIATGIVMTNLKSQIVVAYESSNRTEMLTNSFSGSLMKGNAKFKKSKDTVLAEFTFESFGFVVPVIYRLTDRGFSATIDVTKVKETKDNSIISIKLLPYFAASTVNDAGYIVVPDGSGAVIEFNNGKTGVDSYEKDFYGADQTIVSKEIVQDEKNLELPVFGEKLNHSAFLAVVTEGAACGRLHAQVSGHESSYNSVYTSLVYRSSTQIEVRDNSWTTKSVMFTALDRCDTDHFTVEYRFLDESKSDYVGMAEETADALKISGKGASGEPFLNLTIYGAANKDKSFLGFRYTATEQLTTFAQAEKIVKDISSYSKSPEIVLKNFTEDELSGKMATGFDFISGLGGNKGYRSLLSAVKKANGNISVYADFTRFAKNGNGFNKKKNVCLGLDLGIAKIYPYSRNTAMQDETEDPYYLSDSSSYGIAVADIISAAKENQIENIYLDESVSALSSDFRRGGNQRNKTQKTVSGCLQKIAKNTAVVMNDPNYYSLKYADRLTGIPTASSDWQIFDYDIPFLKMVLDGKIDCSGEPINFGGFSKSEFLKHIECGVNLSFAVTSSNAGVLLGTEEGKTLYAAEYGKIADTVKDWYKQLSDVIRAANGTKIVKHSFGNSVAKTTYENGTAVYVNYGTDDVTADGIVIPAENYVLIKGDHQ